MDEAVAMVDHMIVVIGARDTVPSGEIVNNLLDLRNILTELGQNTP